ncbi:MAG: hypothetical protein FD148_781, partial [Methylocystaceae bacterium]
RGAGRAGLAQTVRRSWHPSRITGVAKPVPETLFCHSPPVVPRDQGEVPCRALIYDARQIRQHWSGQRRSRLFRTQIADTVLNMLSAESRGVAAAQPRVEQDCESQPLARADRPMRLEGRDLFVAPNMESAAL